MNTEALLGDGHVADPQCGGNGRIIWLPALFFLGRRKVRGHVLTLNFLFFVFFFFCFGFGFGFFSISSSLLKIVWWEVWVSWSRWRYLSSSCRPLLSCPSRQFTLIVVTTDRKHSCLPLALNRVLLKAPYHSRSSSSRCFLFQHVFF